VLQEIAIDATIFYFTEAERSEEPDISSSTLKALRRLSFLVPLGDILPEALLVFRRKGGIALFVGFVSPHHKTISGLLFLLLLFASQDIMTMKFFLDIIIPWVSK